MSVSVAKGTKVIFTLLSYSSVSRVTCFCTYDMTCWTKEGRIERWRERERTEEE